MIDQFTKTQFEDTLFAIHPGYESLGLINGEEVFIIPVTPQARLKIRSSVDSSGYAADSGQDSIRLWIEVYQPHWRNGSTYEWQACGKKVDAYTTRLPGWEKRLEGKIRLLWDKAIQVRQPVEKCLECGTKKAAFVNKKNENKDRPFATCKCDKFEWLDEVIENGVAKYDISTEKLEVEVSHNRIIGECDTMRIGDDTKVEPAPILVDIEDTEQKNVQEMPEKIPGYEGLNDAQYLAAVAPIEANLRLLAPPGSGKTHTVKYRYQYLVESGIDPDNILVVTFSKKMADEMAQKISDLVPFANVEQICTIHAFCYRLLRSWYDTPYSGHNYPKQSWKIKSILDDLISVVWNDKEKPNYSEVLNWIDLAKYHNKFDEKFFLNHLGYRSGGRVWEIAKSFQHTMQSNREMLFSDMLMYVEQLLESDSRFREWCHNRFQQIIIDEAQDTNWQVMKVLIAISENCKPSEVGE